MKLTAITAGVMLALASTAPALARPAPSTATTPIAVLERHPETRMVMEAYMPGLTQHPNYPKFFNLSLKQLQAYDPRITDQTLARIDAGLAAASAPPSVATTPIFILAGRPETLAVLEAHFPGMTGHPNYSKFRYLSLKELQGYDPRITDDMLAAAQSALDAAVAKAPARAG